jgi:hypothetical protein
MTINGCLLFTELNGAEGGNQHLAGGDSSTISGKFLTWQQLTNSSI